jgi:hypothetical protein
LLNLYTAKIFMVIVSIFRHAILDRLFILVIPFHLSSKTEANAYIDKEPTKAI